MSIIDDLIESLVERNTADVQGTFSITLVPGGVQVKGHLFTTLRDQRRQKEILKVDIPVDAQLKVPPTVIPLPRIT
jgi:hypothetical protein